MMQNETSDGIFVHSSAMAEMDRVWVNTYYCLLHCRDYNDQA